MTKSAANVNHGDNLATPPRRTPKRKTMPRSKKQQPVKKPPKSTRGDQTSTNKAAPDSLRGKPLTTLPAKLLKWYDSEQRALPWRAPPGAMPNPYHVWLSEIMLQQTVVKTVIPYFNNFTRLWPTIADLAAASQEDIRRAWAGLGYYSRAENLHKCAKIIVTDYEGKFPIFAEELETLPGIGPYTAAAIAAIAFDETATPVDGNIERVVARLFEITEPLPHAKPTLRQHAARLTPPRRAGDFAQAQMDLGARICTPKNPSCLLCPISAFCKGYHQGSAATLPRRAAKKPKPTRYGAAFFALREDGMVLLHQRPEGGLLSGMTEIPSSDWLEDEKAAEKFRKSPPVKGEWWRVPGLVKHTFTHFHLELAVYRSLVAKKADLTLFADATRCRWVHRDQLASEALPSVMRKVVSHALNGIDE